MRRILVTAALTLLAACSGADAPMTPPMTPMEAHQALTGENGDGLNGDGLNGDGLNGDGLNGDGLNGLGLGTHLVSVSYASATQYGSSLDGTWLQGSELFGRRGTATFQADDLVGVQFTALSDTGVNVTVRVNGVWQDAAPNQDVWYYDVSYLDPAHQAWWPLCRDATGAKVPAIAVDGWWSYAQGVPGGGAKTEDGESFTFACRGMGAIGKCIVPFGYKPWASVNGVSVDRYHQACVRMVRADFCGEGKPYTQNGNRINLYDGLGIQQDTEPWFMEAEWDENGARCFFPLNRSRAFVPCYLQRLSLLCGLRSDFSRGALLMDETPTLGLTP